ncbi:MAG TPA: DJ-1/PfpI family protein, partial [Magnetospirillum sp.]|nr:DJ-1/PfpI family protein [Magnetospirillum sp.]
MPGRLQGKKVAILATDGFEQSELTEPKSALENEGAKVDVISPHDGRIQGMRHHDKGDTVAVNRTLDSAKPEDYDALMLPGGVANPDA